MIVPPPLRNATPLPAIRVMNIIPGVEGACLLGGEGMHAISCLQVRMRKYGFERVSTGNEIGVCNGARAVKIQKRSKYHTVHTLRTQSTHTDTLGQI